MKKYTLLVVLSILIIIAGCEGDSPIDPMDGDRDLTNIVYNPTAYALQYPDYFPRMVIPEDNPMTEEGILLGKHLFYDPILSLDSTVACVSCHAQDGNFTDNRKVSIGVGGALGTRSSMNLLNVGFNIGGFFWDGRAATLEEHALEPVINPVEMKEDWVNVIKKLNRHDTYPEMFRSAFGIKKSSEITKELAAKAIAQFERTLVSSGNSKYDRWRSNLDVLTDEEQDGYEIFFDINDDISTHAECGHCHNAELFTTNEYFNNGTEIVNSLTDFIDMGRGDVTNVLFDNGTFRVPTLRNIEFSAPYMHDGIFETLDEVIDHYVSGGHHADNLASVLRPLNLGVEGRASLIAFIKTLRDDDFINNTSFNSPF